ncbi:MAG: hypothetical protein A3F95_01440 [Candidatus Nealsonbacteria bacterium RIFCSPLOWO2_12_FULL_39_31]|uniref:Uncharacterized protein n=2 Tax=Candidatus Nealsoniibacteriota TaxID=1817911 RepID=A0A1G2EP14_9BACT|nr:MAG: hypothetical protein A2626_03125 [Candidatus Nealsonbacteria bacterium RIFCSPHIGHO2_01_FULL_38_55]OGZ20709.1 MAG: hypothetical protein A2W55_02825 [Candidatus Nealsonbacteria bacterium RIFCSPHIGHO2_02_38_10]OGZ21944.1 MAG: hypothetical protein A3C48_01775 [Candidatus Nealsonbacteria bacterium RIFCSPHIGHO2_02_FULL_38_75]OGZ23104.1 MAG: hypothetical protein A3E18_02680 [Candidatus Nealsonbacteria bacterium RIFCSPHIGHO2_12_FULL_38_18]OGZ23211.1 MAG: hypothetical protein A2981_02915 [Candid
MPNKKRISWSFLQISAANLKKGPRKHFAIQRYYIPENQHKRRSSDNHRTIAFLFFISTIAITSF